MISDAINRAFVRRQAKNYPHTFWCVDAHGVIFENNYIPGSFGGEIFEACIKPLQFLSSKPEHVLILWTSSHREMILQALQELDKYKIKFDYVNQNPVIENDKLCDFSQKFYFDILLDDKAGFYAKTDWHQVDNTLYSLYREDYHV